MASESEIVIRLKLAEELYAPKIFGDTAALEVKLSQTASLHGRPLFVIRSGFADLQAERRRLAEAQYRQLLLPLLESRVGEVRLWMITGRCAETLLADIAGKVTTSVTWRHPDLHNSLKR